jgi:hypothetical protein
MPDPVDTATNPSLLSPGTKVEVRTGFDRSWVNGFFVAELTDEGYRVRRRTDDQLLPVAIAHADVRKEHRDNMWWY